MNVIVDGQNELRKYLIIQVKSRFVCLFSFIKKTFPILLLSIHRVKMMMNRNGQIGVNGRHVRGICFLFCILQYYNINIVI